MAAIKKALSCDATVIVSALVLLLVLELLYGEPLLLRQFDLINIKPRA